MAKPDNRTKRTKQGSTKAAAAPSGGDKKRSGGAVDAPGKQHRKAMPPDPDAKAANSQAAKMRTAMPMAKTNRLRGRG
jgi:hypothetical protein